MLPAGNQLFPLLGDWLLVTGIVGFFAMGLDKARAIGGEWRVPEKTLFMIALGGGSFGMAVGGLVFHHKTSKASFQVVLYSILIVWVYALQDIGFVQWFSATVIRG